MLVIGIMEKGFSVQSDKLSGKEKRFRIFGIPFFIGLVVGCGSKQGFFHVACSCLVTGYGI
jgi:hypothetical protein